MLELSILSDVPIPSATLRRANELSDKNTIRPSYFYSEDLTISEITKCILDASFIDSVRDLKHCVFNVAKHINECYKTHKLKVR